jgi:lipoyl synthase
MPEAINRPDWLKVRFRQGNFSETVDILSELRINTICDDGLCPNRNECFNNKVASFMLLGNACTRNCKYCNVSPGRPGKLDLSEPLRVAEAVQKLSLKYVVVTSVNRDDLADGGASVFIETVKKIKELSPECKIELLIPDFQGDMQIIKSIIESGVDVIGHNIETVQELFSEVRPQGNYQRSLLVLKMIKRINLKQKTKSGLMLGLGETNLQIERTLLDLRRQGVDFITLGQYLQPSPIHQKIVKYYTPLEFAEWKERALKIGFVDVESGPLVRSSYRADKLAVHLDIKENREGDEKVHKYFGDKYE